MHPRFGVEREYAVRVLGTLDEEAKAAPARGRRDRRPERRASSSIEDGGGEGANHWYRVVITEGRNREVRKLFDAVGLTVSRLIRIRYGTVVLPRGLKRGVWVDLDEADVRAIRRLASGDAQRGERRRARPQPRARHRATTAARDRSPRSRNPPARRSAAAERADERQRGRRPRIWTTGRSPTRSSRPSTSASCRRRARWAAASARRQPQPQHQPTKRGAGPRAQPDPDADLGRLHRRRRLSRGRRPGRPAAARWRRWRRRRRRRRLRRRRRPDGAAVGGGAEAAADGGPA